MYWIHNLPHKENSDGISAHDFRKNFLKICKQHRKDDKALAFAFLLYRLEDANVIKTLKDKDYWKALDKVSGRYVSVFVFYSPMRQPRSKTDNWKSETVEKASAARDLLQEHFSMNQRLKLPCILFFQVKDEQVVDSYMVPISGNTKEETFLKVRDILDAVPDALDKVTRENKDNAQEIFNLIRSELYNRNLKGKIRKGVAAIGVAKLVGILFKLGGAG